MQKITRKVGETINIGERIQLTILSTKGSTARIAVFDPNGRTVAASIEPNCNENMNAARAPLISGSLFGEEKTDLLE